MVVRVEEIKFKNFEEEDDFFIVFCLEKFNEKEANYDRSFIAFEKEDMEDKKVASRMNGNLVHETIKVKEETLSIIQEKEDEIHLVISNMDKIQKIIGRDDIKVTACTHQYWEDVRLFMHSNRFNYAADVINTSAIELELGRFVKNKYYAKDLLAQSCEDGDITEAIKILHKSKFKAEELEDVFLRNSSVKTIFESHNLHELLTKELDSESNSKARKLKI